MLRKWFTVTMAAFAVLANACAPAVDRSSSVGSAPDAVASQPRTPKTITIAQDFEPPDIQGFTSLVRPTGSGGLKEIVHNHLARRVRDGVIQTELAAELPSIEKGTWRVNPDGSMDV